MSAAQAATWRHAVRHDDEQIRIDWFAQSKSSSVLVITFDPLLYLADKPHFGENLLRKLPVDIVAVRKKDENFYQSLSREAFVAAVQPVLRRYRRIVAYGSSLGAYAALYFCRDIDCEVIASSPRVSAHPDYGAKAWQSKVEFRHQPFAAIVQPRCRAIVIFDPHEPQDRRYIEGEVLPQFPQAEVMRVPYSGHPSNHFLGEIGYIAPFVRAVVAGAARPMLNRRQRVRSSTYFQVLAAQCAQRGKPRWAGALIERSLVLNPRNTLAHRTLARLRLQQERWAEAVVALESALRLSPEDALTHSLLKQAREQLAPQAAEVASAQRREHRARKIAGRLRAWLGRR